MSVRTLIAAALAAALVLVGSYAALGGGRYEPQPVADPCTSPSPRGSGLGQNLSLGAVDAVACLLHVSREELALALVSKRERDRLGPLGRLLLERLRAKLK
jgi:hypothetical protein